MFVRHVPVLISRMKQKGKTGSVTEAGIPAVSDCSPCILPDIIRVKFRARDGDSASCINFHICPNGMNRWDVWAADGVQADARLI